MPGASFKSASASFSAIFCCKMGAYCVTGSSAMLAEAVHSVADIVNQGLLRVGINSSAKAPDAKYNYGYRRERFVWSLISAVGVFFIAESSGWVAYALPGWGTTDTDGNYSFGKIQ